MYVHVESNASRNRKVKFESESRQEMGHDLLPFAARGEASDEGLQTILLRLSQNLTTGKIASL
jgi:hypothetical protein